MIFCITLGSQKLKKYINSKMLRGFQIKNK